MKYFDHILGVDAEAAPAYTRPSSNIRLDYRAATTPMVPGGYDGSGINPARSAESAPTTPTTLPPAGSRLTPKNSDKLVLMPAPNWPRIGLFSLALYLIFNKKRRK